MYLQHSYYRSSLINPDCARPPFLSPSVSTRYGLLDDRVRFVKGFFNESLPPVCGNEGDDDDGRIGSDGYPVRPTFALLRIDADGYDGVIDVLNVCSRICTNVRVFAQLREHVGVRERGAFLGNVVYTSVDALFLLLLSH